MNNWFNFRDDEEREMFYIAIPVIAFFGLLGYWLMKEDLPEVAPQSAIAVVADSDGDGVTDNSDHCINTPGDIASYGCPEKVAWADRDNDTDGIRNGIDECPETKGVLENNGCVAIQAAIAEEAPVELLDSDGDGVPDEMDACFAVAGSEEDGCPADRDADGIADTDDQCPDVAGPAESNGCLPDADNDGVLGEADKCPDQIGSAMSEGCPEDTDGDGVDDMQDQCPTVAANEADGCPVDSDADGLADSEDNCPTEAGLEDNRGCPADEDNDGISDANDRCPQQAGVEANQGCPADKDGDGVFDIDDSCPDTAGVGDGCPEETIADRDSDGIADTDDNCPNISGIAQNSGCPEDSDGDGLADPDDNCPATPGDIELLGCPPGNTQDNVEVKKVLDAAISGVKFNSSSAILTARSREVLRTVADLMRKYPESTLEIRGHTDSSGNAGKNLQLSMDRARSCATFIASQGINIDRLKAYGFGDTEPLADNANPIGRERNRRVEFLLKN